MIERQDTVPTERLRDCHEDGDSPGRMLDDGQPCMGAQLMNQQAQLQSESDFRDGGCGTPQKDVRQS